MHDNEKQGGRCRNPTYITNLRDCLSHNQLFDCKPTSDRFTWTKSNCHIASSTIRECLDRFLASVEWLALYPTSNVRSDYNDSSDLRTILLDTTRAPPRMSSTCEDFFCCEDFWVFIPEYISTVQTTWAAMSGSTLGKLKAIGDNLKHWQDERRAHTSRRINHLRKLINRSLERTLTQNELVGFVIAKDELRCLLRDQEVYWAQRSCVQ
ncbi:hypothetical protein V6N13_059989 [Hibiscus sabdariffa]